jgi:hypothetical protein
MMASLILAHPSHSLLDILGQGGQLGSQESDIHDRAYQQSPELVVKFLRQGSLFMFS